MLIAPAFRFANCDLCPVWLIIFRSAHSQCLRRCLRCTKYNQAYLIDEVVSILYRLLLLIFIACYQEAWSFPILLLLHSNNYNLTFLLQNYRKWKYRTLKPVKLHKNDCLLNKFIKIIGFPILKSSKRLKDYKKHSTKIPKNALNESDD